ncbi:class I SAM-dependent methyltransferase [Auritidibacter ignavus]|uniref:class I SAM-dependent methyltransferase n=1 Tax=Auritidibacter ignavus TaxID=678932 RepID=UPI0024BB6CA1|nr:methyltransferase [Auritidibacter ignavus]WHS34563.1 methyltransferase [Auritidibacter ignavus]
MDSAHYFSATPAGDQRRHRITVPLAGAEREVFSAAGVFSHDELDRGTRVLLDTVPAPPPTGRFLDIGSGWGPLALSMALLSPEAEVCAVEVNERARELTVENARALGLEQISVWAPDELDPEPGFDLIWSNPPIRVGKAVLHDILQRWLPRLRPGGHAWLVVAKKLGADSLLPWIATMLQNHGPGESTAQRHATVKGFRILHIHRAQ